MNRTTIIIVFVIIAVLSLLVFSGMRSSTSVVLLPSQLPTYTGRVDRLRVAGRVSDGTIDYKVEPTIELRFSIHDPGKTENPHPAIPVYYQGVKPDMFAPGRDVILDGDFRNGTFTAKTLLTQCPSKYQPPSPKENANGEKTNPGENYK